MIYDVVNFLKLKLDAFVSEGRVGAEPLILLSNPWSNNDSNKGASFLNSLSLISIEEEKIFKTQVPPVSKTKNGYNQKAPDIKLNLYILVSAYNKNYEDALKFISKVVSYFQVINVFSQDDDSGESDTLPLSIEKIIVELHTATFEQQNQIWASLGTGYLPSVIYKVRTIVIDTDIQKQIPVIETIKISTELIVTAI